MTDVDLLLKAAKVLETQARSLPAKEGAKARFVEVVDEELRRVMYAPTPEPEWDEAGRRWVLRGDGIAAGAPELVVKLRYNILHTLQELAGENLAAARDAQWRLKDLLRAYNSDNAYYNGAWSGRSTHVEVAIEQLVAAAYYLDPEEVPPYVEPVKPKESA